LDESEEATTREKGFGCRNSGPNMKSCDFGKNVQVKKKGKQNQV